MKFSILIASYNNAHFFIDCYKSLLAQEYDNWEAIIIDDCSTDDSVELIQASIAHDNRFRFYQNEKNEGVGFTKAKLAELATGEILGYVDPDDAILPSAVSSAAAVFQKEPDVVLSYSRHYKCDANLNKISVDSRVTQVLNGDPFFFNCPIVINHFACFRKSIYETTEKINSRHRIAEDQDLYLKMYEKGRVKFIDDANYLYRTHQGGISQNNNKSKSYRYWAEVIWNSMRRRNLSTINGKKVPDKFNSPQEIFDLLSYQNEIPFRLQKKIKLLFQK